MEADIADDSSTVYIASTPRLWPPLLRSVLRSAFAQAWWQCLREGVGGLSGGRAEQQGLGLGGVELGAGGGSEGRNRSFDDLVAVRCRGGVDGGVVGVHVARGSSCAKGEGDGLHDTSGDHASSEGGKSLELQDVEQ